MSDGTSRDISTSCLHCGGGPLEVVCESSNRKAKAMGGGKDAAGLFEYRLFSCHVCHKVTLVQSEWRTATDAEPMRHLILYPQVVSYAQETRLQELYATVLSDYEHMLWNGD